MNVERRNENRISNLIIGLIKSEYKDRGYKNSEPKVDVEFHKSISIMINTENPFLENGFWNFLDKLIKKVDRRVKIFGYVYKGTSFIHDYCIINYEFKKE